MKAATKQLCYAGAETAVVAGVHWFLIYWLAEKNVVAALFAAGPHLPKVTTVLAVSFVLVRALTVLVVPAMIAGRLARAYVLWRAERCQSP
jgi:hypothetical protein